jgi:hypothetical protein
LVDVRFTAVYDLHGLAVVRRTRMSFEDASAKEDLAAKDYYGGVPAMSSARLQTDTDRWAELDRCDSENRDSSG